MVLFSQTTKSLEGFRVVAGKISDQGGGKVTVRDTICRKVANRIPQLKDFAKMHDVIIFVSGEKSSNGRQLYAVCKGENERTYWVQGIEDMHPEMLKNAGSVGISGATSTPRWIMDEIRRWVEEQP